VTSSQIRELCAEGMGILKIANTVGCGSVTVQRVLREKIAVIRASVEKRGFGGIGRPASENRAA
jgi:response regulator of citrate/malate metabolism